MRRAFVAGNWKMNGLLATGRELLVSLVAQVVTQDVDVVVCPPYPYLAAAADVLDGSSIRLGAQDVHPSVSGAFTGSVSGAMLRDVGCGYVIVGHSERRQFDSESDELVARKAEAALREGLVPIVCVGETGAEREAGFAHDVVERQFAPLVSRLGADALAGCVLAYEPVWAIGTGCTATPAQAQEMHLFLRTLLGDVGASVARSVRIVYGGSVNAGNAAALFAEADIDGALVGGASLKAQDFAAICNAAKAK